MQEVSKTATLEEIKKAYRKKSSLSSETSLEDILVALAVSVVLAEAHVAAVV